MKQLLKISAAPATALFALAYIAIATPAAAGPNEYCRQDVTSGMRSCSFETLEQSPAPTPINRSARFQNPGYDRRSRLKVDDAVLSRHARHAIESSLPCADCLNFSARGRYAIGIARSLLLRVRFDSKQIMV